MLKAASVKRNRATPSVMILKSFAWTAAGCYNIVGMSKDER